MAWKKIQWSDDAAAVTVRKNSGSNIGTRPRLNFVEGSNITLAISDDAGSDEIDISIALAGSVSMAGNLDMNDYKIDDVDDIQAYDAVGIAIKDSAGVIRALLSSSTQHSFGLPLDMGGNAITNVSEIRTESIVKKTTKVDINDIGKLILNDPTELTISGGTVALTQSHHTIDTEGDASTDNLDTITGGTLGQILIIRAANYTRTVVVR